MHPRVPSELLRGAYKTLHSLPFPSLASPYHSTGSLCPWGFAGITRTRADQPCWLQCTFAQNPARLSFWKASLHLQIQLKLEPFSNVVEDARWMDGKNGVALLELHMPHPMKLLKVMREINGPRCV